MISYLVPLSRDKYASIVLQDCIRLGMTFYPSPSFAGVDSILFLIGVASEEIHSEYIRELLLSNRVLQLCLHRYSNYVIQEALSIVSSPLRSQLVNIIQPHLSTLESSPYGANILKQLQ